MYSHFFNWLQQSSEYDNKIAIFKHSMHNSYTNLKNYARRSGHRAMHATGKKSTPIIY